MGYIASEDIRTVTLTIDADPGADEIFYLFKAPAALTVVGAYAISEQTQGAGTAVAFELQNWGTAGTAVKSGGTVVAAVGGTATSARLTARTPAAGVVSASAAYIAPGEWLVVNYDEQGAGWIANDRFVYQVNYKLGNAG